MKKIQELALEEALKIAKIHEKQILSARIKVKNMYPLDSNKVQFFTFEETAFWEILSNRFAKLHDIMGQKIFTQFLERTLDIAPNMTFIDKLNKLERLEIIESADYWKDLRDIRNELAHEYPDRYDAIAKLLNRIYEQAPELIKFLHQLEDQLKALPKS